MTEVLFRLPALSLLPGHKPAQEQMCSAVLNGFISIPISALSVKELPEEELNEGEVKDDNEKYGMVQALSLIHI